MTPEVDNLVVKKNLGYRDRPSIKNQKTNKINILKNPKMHKDIIYYICVILSLSVLAWDQSD